VQWRMSEVNASVHSILNPKYHRNELDG